VGDVVENWARIASDRQTFVFAVNVAHSMHLADEFRKHGIAAEHIDGQTQHEERLAIQRRLRSGETQVLCNCEIMTYGVDYPPVSCIVLARPTRSITRYMQMVGRGLRTHPGKDDCLVLDHAGAVSEVGFVDDPMPWSLDGKQKIQERRKQKAEPKEIECRSCGAQFRAAKYCPSCGAEQGQRYARAVEAHEAELQEIERRGKKKNAKEWTMREKMDFYSELLGYAESKRFKVGWAAHAYRAKLGVWPNKMKSVEGTPPGEDTMRWIKYLNIRRAKARERAAA